MTFRTSRVVAVLRRAWWAIRGVFVLRVVVDVSGEPRGEEAGQLVDELQGLQNSAGFVRVQAALSRATEFLSTEDSTSASWWAVRAAWCTALFEAYSITDVDAYYLDSVAALEHLSAEAPSRGRRFLALAALGKVHYGRAIRTGDADAAASAESAYGIAEKLYGPISKARREMRWRRHDARAAASRRRTFEYVRDATDFELASKQAASGTLRMPRTAVRRMWEWNAREQRSGALLRLSRSTGWSNRRSFADLLSDLSEVRRASYDRTNKLSLLLESEVAGTWALECFPNDCRYLTRLSVVLRMKGMHLDREDDMVRAEILGRQAFSMAGEVQDEDWRACAWNLAIALKRLYTHVSRDVAHLDEAIHLEESLCQSTVLPGELRQIRSNLANSYIQRGILQEHSDDFDRAHSLLESEIAFSRPRVDDTPLVTVYCQASLLRAEYCGDLSGLRETAELADRLRRLLGAHHHAAVVLSTLMSRIFSTLFERDGDLGDANSAVSAAREAFGAHSPAHLKFDAGVALMQALTAKAASEGPRADSQPAREVASILAEIEGLGISGLGDIPSSAGILAMESMENDWVSAKARFDDLVSELAGEIDEERRWRIRLDIYMAAERLPEWPYGEQGPLDLAHSLVLDAPSDLDRDRAWCCVASAIVEDPSSAVDPIVEDAIEYLRSRLDGVDLEDGVSTQLHAALVGLLLEKYARYRDLADRAELVRRIDAWLYLLHRWRPGRIVELAIRLDRAEVILDLAFLDRTGGSYDQPIQILEEISAELKELDVEEGEASGGTLTSRVAELLGTALQWRYVSEGNARDVERSIQMWRTVPMPNSLLLGQALLMRYEYVKSASDLDESISLLSSPEGDDMATEDWVIRTCELGAALRLRWLDRSDAADLEAALQLYREALRVCEDELAGNVELGRHVAGAAVLPLIDEFGQCGDIDSLDAALRLAKISVQDLNAVAPLEGAMRLLALSQALRAKAEAGVECEKVEQLNSCIEVLVSIDVSELGSRVRAQVKLAHAECHLAKFKASGEPPEVRMALSILDDIGASEDWASLEIEVLAARGGALLELGDSTAALSVYERLLSGLRDLAPAWLSRPDRELAIGRYTSVSEVAVELALDLGETDRAVRIFENGSTLLMDSEILFAADLERLGRVAPSIHGEVLQALRSDAESFRQTLLRARAVPGFGDLFEPARSRTRSTGQRVLLLNVGHRSFDVIQVTDAEAVHLRISFVSADQVREMCVDLLQWLEMALSASSGPVVEQADRMAAASLERLWERAVRPMLDGLDLMSGRGDETRIHWCPSGLLRLVPWHAARSTRGDDGVMERVISSYTSSLSALAASSHGPSNSKAPSPSAPVLVVAMPTSPGPLGLADLPGAEAEALWLEEAFGRAVCTFGTAGGGPAVYDSVMRALSSCKWAHFACHATADLERPERSTLVLRDSARKPLTAGDLALGNFAAMQLAFLSACSTGHHGGACLNETLNVGRAFEIGGCRHVVATMWPIYDEVGSDLVRRFYTELQEATVGDDDIARALHVAVLSQARSWSDCPTMWAAHVHVGP